jgi:PHD/YefM family antitoxin component YafN of YafNO toxin-antitoxin module
MSLTLLQDLKFKNGRKIMPRLVETLAPEFIVNRKGNKKAVVLSVKEYESILKWIEDLEDANDLLKAEREATSFLPYDEFRKSWISD